MKKPNQTSHAASCPRTPKRSELTRVTGGISPQPVPPPSAILTPILDPIANLGPLLRF